MEPNLLLSAAIDACIVAPWDARARHPRDAERFGKMILAENVGGHSAGYRWSVSRDEAANLQRLEDYRFAYVEGVTPEGLARLAQFAHYQVLRQRVL